MNLTAVPPNSTISWSRRSWVILVALNAVSALIAGIFGLMALTDPGSRPGLTGPATPDLQLYASLYGIRAVFLTVALLVLLSIDRRRGGDRLVILLWVAGAIQLADTFLFAVSRGDVGMAIGPAIGAVTHLVTAALITRRLSRPRSSANPA